MHIKSDKKPLVYTLLISLSLLLVPFDFVAFNTALYSFQESIGISFNKLSWIINAERICFLFFAGLFFQLAQTQRAKTYLSLGLLLYGLTALFFIGPIKFSFLLSARFCQGLALAMIFSSALQAIEVSKTVRGYFKIGFILAIVLFLTPFISTLLLSIGSTRLLFYGLGAYSVLMSIATFTGLQFKKNDTHKFDLYGFLAIGLSIALFIFGLSVSFFWGWGLASLFLFASFLCFNLSFFFEKSEERPLFELHLLQDKAFFASFLPLLFLQFTLWPLLFFIPIYFQYLLGLPLLSTGLWLLTFTGSVLIGYLISFYFYQRGQIKQIVSAALFLLTLSLFMLNFIQATGHKAYLLTILSLLGFAWGLLFINIYSGGIGLFPEKLTLRGFSFYEIFPFFFGSIGLCLGISIFLHKFAQTFYNSLSQVDLIFPIHINTHFFDILNHPDIYPEAVRKAFTTSFLSGLHQMTTLLSWIGFACLIFTIVFMPAQHHETPSSK